HGKVGSGGAHGLSGYSSGSRRTFDRGSSKARSGPERRSTVAQAAQIRCPHGTTKKACSRSGQGGLVALIFRRMVVVGVGLIGGSVAVGVRGGGVGGGSVGVGGG